MNHTALKLGVRDTREIETWLRELPPAALRTLARGDLPEPECRLCQTVGTLAHIGLADEGTPVYYAALSLLNYHEVPQEELSPIALTLLLSGIKRSHVVHRYIGDLVGTMLFHRCQLIYEIAKRLALQED